MTRWGQSCLLARRMVEAGTRYIGEVGLAFRFRHRAGTGSDGSWDTHGNNFPMLHNWRMSVLDRSVPALLDDLEQRGLLETTLVLAVGEFGRSPKIGVYPRRTTSPRRPGPLGLPVTPACWPAAAYTAARFTVPRIATAPISRITTVHPYDLIATLYHALGIDRDTIYHDTLNRPHGLVEHGEPILGLF